MRTVYRISTTRRAHDLSGKGARLKGGRWNQKDTSILYTSESRSLAAMEFLVHVSRTTAPENISITTIGIPDKAKIMEIKTENLPQDWRRTPVLFQLSNIGSQWVSGMESLLLRVPSAVILREFNILINPAHPDISSVKIIEVEHFTYDQRLRKT